MKLLIKVIFAIQLLLTNVYESVAETHVKIQVGSDLGAPHMMLKNGIAQGIDIDVVKYLFGLIKVDAEFQFVGLARAKQDLLSGKLDAIVPSFIQGDSNNFYVSKPIVSYLPTVFSLAKNNLQAEQLKDLLNHSLVSFQGAVGYFGEQYQRVSEGSPYYLELANMQTIPSLIAKNRFDYAVLDKYIFYYYSQQKQNTINPIFREHKLIEPTYAGVAFSDKTLRDKFNKVVKGFVNSDTYNQIVMKYIGNTN